MERENILDAIEANHWDVEPHFIPKGVESVHNNDITMIKNGQSNSIYTNKVVKCRGKQSIRDLVEQIDAFYKTLPYSWWLGPQDKPGLREYLIKEGWVVQDVYKGLALDLDVWETMEPADMVLIKEVVTDRNIMDLIDISAAIWNYDEKSRLAIFNERKSYIHLPERRGHFLLAYDSVGTPVAYGNDRYSEDGSVLYLKGSATLPDYRGKGFYTALVAHRLNKAKRDGARLATVQARVGTSEPILTKLGFQVYGSYEHLVKGL